MALVLQAQKREDSRASALRQIRENGDIPAIVYGKDVSNESVIVNNIELVKMLRDNGRNAVIKLDVDGKKTDVMVYDMQMDTMKNEIIHVDFYAVDMKAELDADVPLQTVGEAIGTKSGGVLQLSLFEVSVRALPNDVPDRIEVDVSDLEINDTLMVKDLKIDGNFTINNDPEETVLSILPPSDEPLESEASEDSVGEPEVIGESDSE